MNFQLPVDHTADGGETWLESDVLELLEGWAGVSDPALAWDISEDNKQTVYLVALPFAPDDGPIIGIAIYQSTDGGQTWSTPKLIHKSVDPNIIEKMINNGPRRR